MDKMQTVWENFEWYALQGSTPKRCILSFALVIILSVSGLMSKGVNDKEVQPSQREARHTLIIC